MNSDPENIDDTKLYQLMISNIPTYNYEQRFANAPQVWFGNSSNPTLPLFKTNIGYFNGTFNLKRFEFTDFATN